ITDEQIQKNNYRSLPPPNPICKVRNTARLALTLCLALTLTFFAGCFDSSDSNDDSGGWITLPTTSIGKLTITRAPVDKYVYVVHDESGDLFPDLVGVLALSFNYDKAGNFKGGKMELQKIEDSTVEVPLYFEISNGVYQAYAGNDTVDVKVRMFHNETVTIDSTGTYDDGPQKKIFYSVSFSGGNATIDYHAGVNEP
ncbi:MAG: hypothetical protein LBT84_00815, partial [Spirochaetia bacterium]|nr:hypothetical protein [Spirochaetia bacterium]